MARCGRVVAAKVLVLSLAAVAGAGCTAKNPAYVAPAEGCTLGERGCSGTRPAECVPGGDGGTVLRNAACPSGAGCAAGRCVAPAGATSCTREDDCDGGKVCSQLVHGDGLAGACLAPEGALPGAAPCTGGPQCRSGLCVSTGGATPRQICYLACRDNNDCPGGLRCRSYAVTVTGIQGNILGCGPK